MTELDCLFIIYEVEELFFKGLCRESVPGLVLDEMDIHASLLG